MTVGLFRGLMDLIPEGALPQLKTAEAAVQQAQFEAMLQRTGQQLAQVPQVAAGSDTCFPFVE